MNLLEETVKALADNGKSLSDIVAVQGNDFGIPIDEFIQLVRSPRIYGPLLLIDN